MIGIYKIENLTNGKVYIGQSNNIQRRKTEHFNNNNYNKSEIDQAIQQEGLENFSFEMGENHKNSLLSDSEVLKIRERYMHETAREIWQDYKDKYNLNCFKQILIGTRYKHLPVYKKNEKRWANV